MAAEVGTYTLPVILSFEGIDKQVNSKLGKTFEGVGKKASKNLGDGLKQASADVDNLAKSYAKLKDKADDALGKVRTEEAKLVELRNAGKQNTAQYIAGEERLNKARRDSGRATREATDGHSTLLAAQKALGEGTDDLGRRFGGMADFASTAGKALGAAGVVAGGAALAGIAALGTGAVIAGRQLYDLGAQFDDLSDTLQVKTGLSGAALDQLKESVEKLGTTNVPDTFENIGNVAAEVTRNLHLTGKPLEDITSRLANLQRLGVDVDVRALGKAFRGFGVDTKGQVAALNGLYEASTKSGLSIDDMLASVVKGGPALRALGLTFGESAALVSTFEDAGLDADKSIAGLTKGLANFSKDGKTGSAALREAVTQIKALADAGNDAGAIDLANKLFGAKGGVAFFDAIKSGAIDLQSLSDSLSTTGTDINEVSNDTADWSEKWQDLKNKVAVALEPLASGVFDGVNEELGKAAEYVLQNKGVIIDAFTGIADGIVTFAEVSIKSLGLFSQGIGELIAPIGDVLGAGADFQAWQEEMAGNDDRARELRDEAQGYYSMGEGLYQFGETAKNVDFEGLRNSLHEIGDKAKNSGNDVETLSGAIGNLAGRDINVPINVDTGPATQKMNEFFNQWRTAVLGLAPPNVAMPPAPPRPTGPGSLILPPGRATGGPVFGAGTATSDSIPAMLSNGEHVWTAAEVKKVGGQAAMYRMRAMVRGFSGGGFAAALPIETDDKRIRRNGGPGSRTRDRRPGNGPGEIGIPDWSMPGQGWGGPPDWWWTTPIDPNDVLFPDQWGQRPWGKHPLAKKGIAALGGFATGGAIGPDVLAAGDLVGTPYSQANRTDCSGMVARVIDRTLGMPEAGLMSTKNAADWLAARGFQPGIGGPGTVSVGWYDHGPNPNDGHMAMTLSDGTNAEAGGGVGDLFQIGGGAAGADSPQFDQHMFLPTVFGEGQASGGSGGGYGGYGTSSGGGSGGGGGTPGIGPNGESGTYSTPDAKDVREADQKVADADARVRELEAKQRELKADAKESERISAQADLDKAKREAADARTDAADVKKGKFTAGKAGKSGGGAGDLSPLGSIFGSFLKETTGLDGSLFPDISNLAPVKMLGTLLGVFGGGGTDTGLMGSTTSAPFGIPDVAVPPPVGSPASGFGMGPQPGPAAPNITIDQTIHGNVGESYDAVQKRRDASVARAIPRIPVG